MSKFTGKVAKKVEGCPDKKDFILAYELKKEDFRRFGWTTMPSPDGLFNVYARSNLDISDSKRLDAILVGICECLSGAHICGICGFTPKNTGWSAIDIPCDYNGWGGSVETYFNGRDIFIGGWIMSPNIKHSVVYYGNGMVMETERKN